MRTQHSIAPLGSLRWLCWVPLALMLAMEFYIANFDCWGAWASAPLLLVPAIVSLAIMGAGLIDCVVGLRNRALNSATVGFTAVASLPLFWLFVRRYFM